MPTSCTYAHTMLCPLSFLHQQEMHGNIGNDNEGAAEDGEADDVLPEGEVVEAKGGQDGGAWDLDVEAVAVVFEAKFGDFVDDEAFVAVVEDR